MAGNMLPEGMLLRDLDDPKPWIPQIPQIIGDGDGIPTQAFETMVRVGSDVNPHLLRSARMVDLYQTEPIPEVVELLPNEERIPISYDPRFPY